MLMAIVKESLNIIGTYMYAGLWAFGGSLFVLYLLRLVSGERFLVVRAVTHFTPWLLWILIPALILATSSSQIYLGLMLSVPTLYICFIYLPLFIPAARAAKANSPLRVMSHNVWRENSDVSRMMEGVRKNLPDIFLVQELLPHLEKQFIKTMQDEYPERKLHFIYDPILYQGVISHYPLSRLQTVQEKSRALKTSVQTPHGKITVFNVHFCRCGNWSKRKKEMADFVEKEIIPLQGAAIVAGDFNTTDQSQSYGFLKKHLINAHWQTCRGFGFTYPSSNLRLRKKIYIPWPLVRIDHIFLTTHLNALDAQTLSQTGGSDHLPITADLIWTDVK